jgi:DMSO/TMAO reductase YedYZ molybdopterin-dependent catalytic subunit
MVRQLEPSGSLANPCRRTVLQLFGLGTVGLGFGVSVFSRGVVFAEEVEKEDAHRLLMQGTRDFKGVKVSEVTPNDRFYLTTYDGVPDVPLAGWSLPIEGIVEKPLVLSMDDLRKAMDKTEPVTLTCIGNPVGGDAIGNAVWEGVTLKKVLGLARPKPGVVKVVFYAAEGYTDSIPFNMAMDGEVFLAYRMNGEPLPKKHGFPLRAVVPGIYGMKNVKWLEKIELVNYDFQGYWEKGGWSDTAVIHTLSEILMPMDGATLGRGTHILGGIAYAGRRGVREVELSLDDGRTWHPVELKPPLGEFAWTIWRFEWKAETRGTYRLRVRATDGSGKVQSSGGFFATSYPDGATGIQEIKVKVA